MVACRSCLSADHPHPSPSDVHARVCVPAHAQEYDPQEVVRLVFGKETAANEAFIASVARALRMICEKGVPYTLIHIN